MELLFILESKHLRVEWKWWSTSVNKNEGLHSGKKKKEG